MGFVIANPPDRTIVDVSDVPLTITTSHFPVALDDEILILHTIVSYDQDEIETDDPDISLSPDFSSLTLPSEVVKLTPVIVTVTVLPVWAAAGLMVVIESPEIVVDVPKTGTAMSSIMSSRLKQTIRIKRFMPLLPFIFQINEFGTRRQIYVMNFIFASGRPRKSS